MTRYCPRCGSQDCTILDTCVACNTCDTRWDPDLIERLRPEVFLAAYNVELTLRKHDVEKGDSWKDMAIADLRFLLGSEIHEWKAVTLCPWPATSTKEQGELLDIIATATMLLSKLWRGT